MDELKEVEPKRVGKKMESNTREVKSLTGDENKPLDEPKEVKPRRVGKKMESNTTELKSQTEVEIKPIVDDEETEPVGENREKVTDNKKETLKQNREKVTDDKKETLKQKVERRKNRKRKSSPEAKEDEEDSPSTGENDTSVDKGSTPINEKGSEPKAKKTRGRKLVPETETQSSELLSEMESKKEEVNPGKIKPEPRRRTRKTDPSALNANKEATIFTANEEPPILPANVEPPVLPANEEPLPASKPVPNKRSRKPVNYSEVTPEITVVVGDLKVNILLSVVCHHPTHLHF